MTYLRRLILAIMFACVATTSYAQAVQDGFTIPSDVQPYEEFEPDYASGTDLAIIGNGIDANGGVMPVMALQPDDIPSTAPGWLIETDDCRYTTPVADCPLVVDGTTEENKVRYITVGTGAVNFDDAIRNWGRPGTAHCHTYFGNTSNAHSTYKSLRTRANALADADPPKSATTFSGGPYQATSYWTDCVLDQNGNAVPIAFGVVYYVGSPTVTNINNELPRGLRYIFGTNMDDPYDVQFKQELEDANAQPGTAGRYSYPAVGNGFLGYVGYAEDGATVIPNVDSSTHYKSFITAEGENPWPTMPSGGFIKAEFVAPQCYGGRSLWKPGGYLLRQRALDNYAGSIGSSIYREGCRHGEFVMPTLTLTIWYRHQGWDDYRHWTASCEPQANAAARVWEPEREDGLPGWCRHTDWFGGWDDTSLRSWHLQALGTGGGPRHAFNSSQVSYTIKFVTEAAPDGTRNPQVPFQTAAEPGARIKLPVDPGGPFTTRTVQ